jgi:hypothetical protein
VWAFGNFSLPAGYKMKLAAIGLNVLLVITGLFLFATYGAPKENRDIFFVAILFAAPIISVIALSQGSKKTWLRMYFKRKALEEERLALEEKKKIEKLETSENE